MKNIFKKNMTYKAMALMSFLLMVGTAGAFELGELSFMAAIMRLPLIIFMMFGFNWLSGRKNRRAVFSALRAAREEFENTKSGRISTEYIGAAVK